MRNTRGRMEGDPGGGEIRLTGRRADRKNQRKDGGPKVVVAQRFQSEREEEERGRGIYINDAKMTGPTNVGAFGRAKPGPLRRDRAGHAFHLCLSMENKS